MSAHDNIPTKHGARKPRVLRPVTITTPGEVLLDLDGVPTAVGPSSSVSGLLYGWPEPTTTDEEY